MNDDIVIRFMHATRDMDAEGLDQTHHERVGIVVANPEEGIEQLLYPDEIVIPLSKIKILYAYPLRREAIFEYQSLEGFTRSALVNIICAEYQRIYGEDGVDGPGADHDSLNGNSYGAWGQEIGDLLLYEVRQVNQDLFRLITSS